MKCGMIMDPIEHIHVEKDSSFALLLEAQQRHYQLFYLEPTDLWFQDGITWGRMQEIKVFDDSHHWYELGAVSEQPLSDLDLVLMRKDPPFDMNYIYLTYLLEQAQSQGLLVVNNPSSLRDANEKLFTTWFPQCCPPTLISMQQDVLKDFIATHEQVVVKPLDKMGGQSIFRVNPEDQNLNVILETITENFSQLVVAQKFIPEIQQGDKRILMLDGEPVPYALARVPKPGEFRGNLAAGGTGVGQALTDHDYWICEQVSPVLKQKQLYLVGLDVIGDYLTEINVTSPTCIRELDKAFDLNIAGELFDALEQKIV